MRHFLIGYDISSCINKLQFKKKKNLLVIILKFFENQITVHTSTSSLMVLSLLML
jgi:hypothetical protein